MRWSVMMVGVLLTGVLAVPVQAGEGKARPFRFGKGDVGKVPNGWKAAQTHKDANSSIWKVVADDTAPSKSGLVLAQTAQSPGAVFKDSGCPGRAENGKRPLSPDVGYGRVGPAVLPRLVDAAGCLTER